jgi:hypothetical protein
MVLGESQNNDKYFEGASANEVSLYEKKIYFSQTSNFTHSREFYQVEFLKS